MPFSRLHLVEALQRAVAAEGYTEPTPIQERAIPHVLEGKDLLGSAQTGTGKTAAFSLPLLQRLSERKGEGIRALVLSPTRELAAQIGERMTAYGKHLGVKNAVIFGGVSQFHQVRALRAGPAVLVATPGRLLDLCQQKLVNLSKVEILVLDEADRMLDMGFIHDVKRIVGMTPTSRQTLLFSATLPQEIVSLAKNILKQPVRVDVAPQRKTADTVRQVLYFVQRPDKRALLEKLLREPSIERALVFTRTKHGASRVALQLDRAGIGADAIHGDKTQGARERALAAFRAGKLFVLVATDIAARGIDVEGVSHVFNYDMPMDPDSYVHRIGRTGRAGATGLAISFCDSEERSLLRGVERLIGHPVPVEATPDLPAPKARYERAASPEGAPAREGRREREPAPRAEHRPRELRQDHAPRAEGQGGARPPFERGEQGGHRPSAGHGSAPRHDRHGHAPRRPEAPVARHDHTSGRSEYRGRGHSAQAGSQRPGGRPADSRSHGSPSTYGGARPQGGQGGDRHPKGPSGHNGHARHEEHRAAPRAEGRPAPKRHRPAPESRGWGGAPRDANAGPRNERKNRRFTGPPG